MASLRKICVGAFLIAGCDDVSEESTRWSYIHAAIIEPSCATAGCHSKLTAIAGVELSTKTAAYTMLTGRVCGEPEREIDPARNYVTPGSSDYSQLMYQLRGQSADGRTYRDVMPPDLPLPAVEIELVARWIDEGAECD